MAADKTADTDPADRAVLLLQRARELLLECRDSAISTVEAVREGCARP